MPKMIDRAQRLAYLESWRADGDTVHAAAVAGITFAEGVEIIRQVKAANNVSMAGILAEGVAVDIEGSDGRPVHVITHVSDLLRSPAMIEAINRHVKDLFIEQIETMRRARTNKASDDANPRDYAVLLRESGEVLGGILVGVVGGNAGAGQATPVVPAVAQSVDGGVIQAGSIRSGESWTIEREEQDTPAY